MTLFVTGTDTDVGKTVISAGLARAMSDSGIDVGVMKPFAAAQIDSGHESDAGILAKAARVTDPESSITPQFFSIPASPYTASRMLGVQVDLKLVLDEFGRLSKSHDMMLVEGMGGIMTPILKDYFVADLICDMDARAVIVIKNSIGTISHTVMTHKMCQSYGLQVAGVIINEIDSRGYATGGLKRDIEGLTGLCVLGSVPRMERPDADRTAGVIKKEILPAILG